MSTLRLQHESTLTTREKEYVLNMDKISRELWKPSWDKTVSHKMRVKRDPPLELTVDTDASLESASEEFLTRFDKLVHDAVETIYMDTTRDGGKSDVLISEDMIYRTMTGRNNLHADSHMREKIRSSVDFMRHTFIKVKPEGDYKKRYPKVTEIEGAMISGERIKTAEMGTPYSYWKIISEPLLFRVSDMLNQVQKVPIRLTDCHDKIRFTEEMGIIRQALMYRIRMAMHPGFKNNGILMTSLYDEVLGTQAPPAKTRERWIKKITKILDAFVENGFITAFSFERGARNTITKINFELSTQ